MAGKDSGVSGRPNVPAYGGGIVPTYYSGSAARSDIPFSRSAKIIGALIAILLVLFVAWATLSMTGVI